MKKTFTLINVLSTEDFYDSRFYMETNGYDIEIGQPDDDNDAHVTYYSQTLNKNIIIGHIHVSDSYTAIANQLIGMDKEAKKLEALLVSKFN